MVFFLGADLDPTAVNDFGDGVEQLASGTARQAKRCKFAWNLLESGVSSELYSEEVDVRWASFPSKMPAAPKWSSSNLEGKGKDDARMNYNGV